MMQRWAMSTRRCGWACRVASSAGPVPAQGRPRRLHTAATSPEQQPGNPPGAEDNVFRKEVVGQMMDERLYQYLLQHTREPEVLGQLRADTTAQFPIGARMLLSPEQGAFMAWLVGALGARRIIEVGVFTGYSSIAMALALPPGGRLVACDRDPKSLALARQYWEKAGVADRVEVHEGPAAATLDALLAQEGQAGSYDFAFVDADKRGYRAYHEQLLQLVRPGGVIAYDNVLWRGQVAAPGAQDKQTTAMRELNDFLLRDERVDFSLVPIGDGVALCTKRHSGGGV